MSEHTVSRLVTPILLVLTLSAPGIASARGSLQPWTNASWAPATGWKASMVLDWYPNSDHGGLFTAIQKGYFSRYHITMAAHVPSDTSAQIKLVAAGAADFGITYQADLLAARAHHIPVRSVMCIMQHPLDTLMTLKSSGIVRPRQLAGHSIGEAGVPSDVAMVTAMMAFDHSSIHQARLVTVGYNLLTALLLKRVDAIVGGYWTWEAILAAQKGHPVNVMRVERWGVPNYCELVLIASERTVRARPALVRGTVAAMQQGYADAEARPNDAWLALHTQDKSLDKGLVMKSLVLLKPVITDTPSIGHQNPSQWRSYAAWLWAHKLIDAPVDASQAFTNQFLQAGIK